MKKKTKEVNIDEFITDIKSYIDNELGISISSDKIKGLAFAALKEAGLLTKKDKYKTYDHVRKIQKVFNDNLDSDFDWEDIEYFTGNLFYAMRLATRRPLEEINEVMRAYEKNETVKRSQIHSDLILLKESVKSNMYETWRYIEKTQLTGTAILSAKLVKLMAKNKNEQKND